MIVYSVSSVKEMLGLSRKEVRKALYDTGSIYWEWDIKNNGMSNDGVQLCVEHHKQVAEDAIATSLFITQAGVEVIKSYYHGV